MSKLIDLTNEKYGRLTVINRITPPGVPIKWHCKCDCGNECDVRGNDLKNGRTKSCGCLRKEKASENFNDLTGQKFGKLTVLYKTDKRTSQRSIYWHCKCDCGNECDVPNSRLTNKNTQSCGCLHTENAYNSNLVGKIFGKLTVIEKTEKRAYDEIIWKCRCECGNICEIRTNLLTQGRTKSCGCLISTGEEKIKKLLTEANIPFEMQKTFDTCRFPDTKALAKFDFYVNNKYLIEFDGKQHFDPKAGWGEDFNKIKNRDNYKNQWCKENNVPLIRIPYTKLDTLKLEDLILN